jgi:hypothetical protein
VASPEEEDRQYRQEHAAELARTFPAFLNRGYGPDGRPIESAAWQSLKNGGVQSSGHRVPPHRI